MTTTLKQRMAATRNQRRAQMNRVWLMFGWLGVVLTLFFSLTPPLLTESGAHADKVVHLAGYATLMFWWAQLITRTRWKLAVAIILFGALIELLQGLTPNRQPDMLDVLANSSGILLGWFIAHHLPNLPERLAALFARPG